MRSIIIQSLLAVGCLRTVVAQYAFTVPKPAVADFNPVNNIVQGTVVNIVWIANSTYQPTITGQELLDSNGDISVWITSYNGNNYTKCLTPSANSLNGGSWAWNVTLSDDDIDTYSGRFVYRLKPTVANVNVAFNTTEDECPSRGFTILKSSNAGASSSASAASASQTAASKSAASGTTTAASTTGTSSPTGSATNTGSPSPSGGLSGGAKAGIAIGVVAIVGIAAIAAFLLWRRRHSGAAGSKAAELSGTAQYAPAPAMQDKHVYGYTDHPHSTAPVELADTNAAPVELPASTR